MIIDNILIWRASRCANFYFYIYIYFPYATGNQAGHKIEFSGVGLSEAEKKAMKDTEYKLLAIAAEEKRNEEELDRIMKRAQLAAKKAEKHMSFREKSIKAREDKKKAQRQASGGAFGLLKKVLMAIGAALGVVALLAILGCELGIDGLKESFVCTIGKPPPEDRRLVRSRYLRGAENVVYNMRNSTTKEFQIG
jgi:hypothetical protein